MTDRYSATNARLLARTGRMMLLYAALVGGLGYVYTSLPSAFLPTEDQGYMNTDVQLPPGARCRARWKRPSTWSSIWARARPSRMC